MHEMHSIQKQREKETLEKIKQKVARIKANQQKFEPNLIPAKTHQEGNTTLAIKTKKQTQTLHSTRMKTYNLNANFLPSILNYSRSIQWKVFVRGIG